MRFAYLLILFTSLAWGQSVPNGTITQGQVWSAAQWNTAWAAKVDYPLNLASLGYGVNVFTYGAKCDGSTDDTTAFQNAAAAIPAVGGTLLIPSGANCVIGGWVQLKSGTVVLAYGATFTANTTTLAAGGWAGPMYAIYAHNSSPIFGPAASATNWSIHGGTYNYPAFGGTGYSNSWRPIEMVTGNNNALIEGITCNGGGDCTANIGANSVYETNNIALNGTNACFDNWNSFSDVTITNSYCSLGTGTNNAAGIQCTGENPGATLGSSYGCTITGNTIYVPKANDQGININGFTTCGGGAANNRVTVADNRVLMTTYATGAAWGILVSGCSSNVEISDNYIEQTITGPSGDACVAAQSPATNVKIHGNLCANWAGLGTYGNFSNASVGGTLENNTCENCTVSSAASTPTTIIGQIDTGGSSKVAGNDVGTGVYSFQSPLNLALGTEISKPSWGITGVGFSSAAATFNDTTTGSGGVATDSAYSFAAPTFTNIQGTANVLTNAENLYVAAPICGSGWASCTNLYSIVSPGLVNFTGGATINGANIALNGSSNFNTSLNAGTSTGAVNLGNQSGTGSAISALAPMTFNLGTALSQATWGVAGIGIKVPAATYNDTTTGSGGVTTDAAYAISAPTFTNTQGTSNVLTNAETLNVAAPVCGSGWTSCTNLYSIVTGGSISVTGSVNTTAGAGIAGGSVNLNVNSNNAINIGSGTDTAAISIGGNANKIQLGSPLTSNGTAFAAPTLTTCSGTGSITGGPTAGSFTVTTGGTGCLVQFTGLLSQPHGYRCDASDETAKIGAVQSAHSASSCTMYFAGAIANGDTLSWSVVQGY